MTLRLKSDEPGRNEPCSCESGLKYKHCHGDPVKRAACNKIANEAMTQLILQEKRKRGLPIEYKCPDCNQEPDIMRNCEFCDSTGIVTEKQVKEKYDELTKGEKDG